MKAMGFNRHGTSEVIEEAELKDPAPENGEVLVRLKSTSVNRLDILVREGIHGMQLGMPHVPGSDILGTVEKNGENAGMFSQGDLVLGNTVYGCGTCDKCAAGNENLCMQWKCIGLHVNGTYGELISVPERILSPAPKTYSEDELAALPLDLSVAWRALHTLSNAQTGETVLVRGASGNVGIFAIKLARAMGLNVIAATRSAEKESMLKAAGADSVISAADAISIKNAVMSATQDRGADIIIETMGRPLDESVNLAAYSGRIVAFGTIAGAESSINVRRLYLRNISILGMHNASKHEFDDALEFAIKKGIRPAIAKKLPITDAAEAQRCLESSAYFGKIILQHKNW
ncbi:MAG: zinc-binding dehydrogenase [Candidatus Marsarchaeota archaeon]|jgi:NADPH2:quinone reductase|nr:zinc-binding dehydrogenase [Candidatus Marsarchaeota archaeon]